MDGNWKYFYQDYPAITKKTKSNRDVLRRLSYLSNQLQTLCREKLSGFYSYSRSYRFATAQSMLVLMASS
jgi:hypothetical protein